ncbi:MAG: ferritin-like domain-containing protein [Francisellaceae bacterium]|jgi:uncharacterized ferritin-like protein (DUF455 family)|nr:ferritin-like domain-containing protein [Francisellaceae bacterium]MBT6539142.1 ferritin-like domain-containing protein [Francisellaceae bacterium]
MEKCSKLEDCNNLQELTGKVLFTKLTSEKLKVIAHVKDLKTRGELDFSRVPASGYIDFDREDKPELVSLNKVVKRKINSLIGRCALIHAVAHIEFNAIHLAADAIYRFDMMPEQFYLDWCQVMIEEAKHFCMLSDYLNTSNYKYGDFVAHNGLWEMAQKTAHSVTIRMALVPRLLEARGLDVTPGIIEKFKTIKDDKAVAILDTIFIEEIGHVKIGNRWYNYCCKENGFEPISYFKNLLNKYAKNFIREPIYDDARLEAGFSTAELNMLHEIATINE